MMWHLLKKELSELLNKQMLLMMLVSFVMILVLGLVMTSTVSDTMETVTEVHIIDRDNTDFTQEIAERLEKSGYTVLKTTDTQPYETVLEVQGWKEAVVLPAGMTEQLLTAHQVCTLDSVTLLKTTSAMQIYTDVSSTDIVYQVISSMLTGVFLQEQYPFLEHPLEITDYTVANGNIVQADSTVLLSSVAMFDQLMPLVLFLLVVLTSQTIITAIGAEKTDKTLEMLLSSPVPRSAVICAKMLAALLTALLYAAVYGIGFATSLLFTVDNTAANLPIGAAFTQMVQTRQAIRELGLQISFPGWVGVGVQLFLTLGIALVASTILGGLVEDVKSSQTASLPILTLTMFPYILSMTSDIRNAGTGIRWLLYCIPFTHTFIATGCLRFHQTGLFLGGMLYQAVFLLLILCGTLKLYQSDILFVHRSGRKHRSEK